MLGRTAVDLVSTYCRVASGPGALAPPPVTETLTAAGPAPSCGRGASGGTVSAAGGDVAVIEVSLCTVNWPTGICQAPAWICATSGWPSAVKPDPVIVTVPPVVGSTAGVSPV